MARQRNVNVPLSRAVTRWSRVAATGSIALLVASGCGSCAASGRRNDVGGADPIAFTAPRPADLPPTARLRESRYFRGHTGPECYRVYWLTEPEPRCAGAPDGAEVCACAGFYVGRSGPLVLVRSRPGAADEYLDLGGLFADSEAERLGGDALVAEYPPMNVTQADGSVRMQAAPIAQPILKLADYNRDGVAAEFVLHVGNEACNHGRYLLVGVLAANTAVTTPREAGPSAPPVAFDAPSDWEHLRETGALRREYWGCFDQGSEVRKSVRARVVDGQFEVEQLREPCVSSAVKARRMARRKHHAASRGWISGPAFCYARPP
jgi:hypothetical protein